jgi:1-aminocyclopropane-1-carboxylate deaminase
MNLASFLKPHLDSSFILRSRVHHLKNFCDKGSFFVKRDDELSFGISGCKFRKYASLLPFLEKNKFTKVALVGSCYSNHIVGFLQLLHEKNIDYHLFLHKTHEKDLKGNHLLLHLLSDKTKRTILDQASWKKKDHIIPQLIEKNTYYVPEGALCRPALFGGMTLAEDLLVNEKCLKIKFDHLFIDAGSGFSAIALLLGLSFAKHDKYVHIVQTYYDTTSFEHHLMFFKSQLERILQIQLVLPPYFLYPSCIGKSFGSTPKCVFESLVFLAKNQGILTDPIYTAKLFPTAKEISLKKNLEGNKLIIHSGGGLSLMGFLSELTKLELETTNH